MNIHHKIALKEQYDSGKVDANKLTWMEYCYLSKTRLHPFISKVYREAFMGIAEIFQDFGIALKEFLCQEK